MSNANLFSSSRCSQEFSIAINCSIILSDDNTTIISLGPYGIGEFPGDPDIAGIGVMAAFYGVSILTLILSVPLAVRKLWFIWKTLEQPW
ncbi:hypothetical protein DL767_009264 [Monosporascus sp. MG133]|nr:hypothetical protein DL767_009264 [Monosporascus sp. MG133]